VSGKFTLPDGGSNGGLRSASTVTATLLCGSEMRREGRDRTEVILGLAFIGTDIDLRAAIVHRPTLRSSQEQMCLARRVQRTTGCAS
jgi:hypothetical protein